MKKAILTFGLFSLVVLTSFTTTETKTQSMVAETGDNNDTGAGRSQGQSIGNKKLDLTSKTNGNILSSTTEYSNNSFNVEIKKKSDI